MLADSRVFSAACINVPEYLSSRYSLLSPWHLKTLVSQTARGAFWSLATYQHRGKNAVDIQLQGISRPIYKKKLRAPFPGWREGANQTVNFQLIPGMAFFIGSNLVGGWASW